MAEHPILFSGEMVRAIMEGRKTQTRRVIMPQAPDGFSICDAGLWVYDGDRYSHRPAKVWRWHNGPHQWPAKRYLECPYGQIGDRGQQNDRLWVREAIVDQAPGPGRITEVTEQWSMDWARQCTLDEFLSANEWRYAADAPVAWEWEATIPSIHMPRFASRITLELTQVRVQRVQDINHEDAMAEGFPGEECGFTPWQWFVDVWQRINAKRGYDWVSNPWVWALTFRRVTDGQPHT